MSDLIRRLRGQYSVGVYGGTSSINQDAADLIEQLQKENEALKSSIKEILDDPNTYRMYEHEQKNEELWALIK